MLCVINYAAMLLFSTYIALLDQAVFFSDAMEY